MYFRQKGRDGTKHGTVSIGSVTGIVLQNRQRDVGSTLVWIILAGLVALGIYLLIDANFVRIPGVGLMAAMALYLIYDHFTQPSGRVISIKAGDEHMNIPVSNNVDSPDFRKLQGKLMIGREQSKPEESPTKAFALR